MAQATSCLDKRIRRPRSARAEAESTSPHGASRTYRMYCPLRPCSQARLSLINSDRAPATGSFRGKPTKPRPALVLSSERLPSSLGSHPQQQRPSSSSQGPTSYGLAPTTGWNGSKDREREKKKKLSSGGPGKADERGPMRSRPIQHLATAWTGTRQMRKGKGERAADEARANRCKDEEKKRGRKPVPIEGSQGGASTDIQFVPSAAVTRHPLAAASQTSDRESRAGTTDRGRFLPPGTAAGGRKTGHGHLGRRPPSPGTVREDRRARWISALFSSQPRVLP
ncbi:hypothetical protein CDD83_10249 [Cordyceps sp. RAO-2017]|nr:hypothetical protein CDD83_10249 [Cordyceps sp. RAO-2017]